MVLALHRETMVGFWTVCRGFRRERQALGVEKSRDSRSHFGIRVETQSEVAGRNGANDLAWFSLK
jgi:hypothetical protein